jgi:putative ABC transport system ATP-binding protein
VRCRGLAKYFGAASARVSALQGVDLDVFSGELLMLVGPSGSGKTTLISILAAILDPDDGERIVLGRNPAQMAENERVRFRGRSIGFVFQGFNLLAALTAQENVAVPLLLHGEGYEHAMDQARRMLEKVGLGGRIDTPPSQLSGGQQQRIAIARALVHEPKLIVCDEPTSNLDHETGQEMMTLLRDLARRPGRSLVVVTHDNRIFGFADRIARMEDGRITGISSENHTDNGTA